MTHVIELRQHPEFMSRRLSRRLREIERYIQHVVEVATYEGEVDEFQYCDFCRKVSAFLWILNDYQDLGKAALGQLQSGKVPAYLEDFFADTEADLQKLKEISGGL